MRWIASSNHITTIRHHRHPTHHCAAVPLAERRTEHLCSTGYHRRGGVGSSCRYGSEWYALVVIGTIRLRLVAGQHRDGDARLWLVEPWFRYHTFMSRPRKRRRQPDQSSVGQSPTVSTYQTRSAVYEGRDRGEGDAALSAYAELYGRVQRKLFADVVAGRSAASLKSEYIEKHGIPARMFNGVGNCSQIGGF